MVALLTSFAIMTRSQKAAVRTSRLVLLLWSLIFAKCFALEYYVQVYAVPIHSALYVWCLSLLMACAATFVFLRMHLQEVKTSLLQRPYLQIWGTCMVAVLLAVVIVLSAQSIPADLLPAFLAMFIGAAYISHARLNKQRLLLLSGIGWWIGAGILITCTQDTSKNLLLFAVLIISLTTGPIVAQLLKREG